SATVESYDRPDWPCATRTDRTVERRVAATAAPPRRADRRRVLLGARAGLLDGAPTCRRHVGGRLAVTATGSGAVHHDRLAPVAPDRHVRGGSRASLARRAAAGTCDRLRRR